MVRCCLSELRGLSAQELDRNLAVQVGCSRSVSAKQMSTDSLAQQLCWQAQADCFRMALELCAHSEPDCVGIYLDIPFGCRV